MTNIGKNLKLLMILMISVYSLTRGSRFCFNTEHMGKLLMMSSFQCIELYTDLNLIKLGLTLHPDIDLPQICLNVRS